MLHAIGMGAHTPMSQVDPFFEMSLDPAAILDPEGRAIRANAAWETAFGYTGDELTGKPIAALLPPQEAEQLREWVSGLTPGAPAQSLHTSLRTRQGENRVVEIVARRRGLR